MEIVPFHIAVFAVAVFSGATATVVGFGIGSMLTPLIASRYGMDVAVAAVVIPHALATALRCWRLRQNIDRDVLLRFGLVSAAGGLMGALLYSQLTAFALTRILGFLLVLTALAQLGELASRWHPRGVTIGALGLLSGFFGGLAGNQGGLRAAALTAFRLTPAAFVATATATGLLVDMARVPVYAWKAGEAILALAVPITIAAVGVLLGTLIGERILLGLSPARFRQVITTAIGALGIYFLLGSPLHSSIPP